MKNHIATYFYHDIEDQGATYGNIFLPLDERNKVYWQTVYTLFFSLIVLNKKDEFVLTLFTNAKNFPLRMEIESLGVTIYDDLILTSRNDGKWATVKFFFDVLCYISECNKFNNEDAILLLDTDVVAMQPANALFSAIHKSDRPIAYILDQQVDSNSNFHGLSICALEDIGLNILGVRPKIEYLIGGEFFLFKKSMLKYLNNYFTLLKTFTAAVTLTTEEQILTIIHGITPWSSYPNAIQRVWTTLKKFNPPNEPRNKIFLHLPSEKEDGLDRLFNLTMHRKPEAVTAQEFYNLVNKSFFFNIPALSYALKIKRRLFGYLREKVKK